MSPSRAFSIVELLVVIAIIGVLAALLLPAIQAAREASRRAMCQNNLKQISLAVLNYANAQKGHLPSLDHGGIPPENGGLLNGGFGWCATVLPYLEEQKLFEQLHFDKDPGEPENHAAVKTILPVFLCPSAPGSPRFVTYFDFPLGAKDYHSVSYIESIDRPENSTFDSLDFYDIPVFHGEGAWLGTDAWSYAHSVDLRRARLAQVTDGLSHTVLVVERGSDVPHNFQSHYPLDDLIYNGDENIYSGLRAWRGVAFWAWCSHSIIWTCDRCSSYPRGELYHPGGANVAMCDGSVHFLSAEQDNGIIWAIVTRAGQEVIGPDW